MQYCQLDHVVILTEDLDLTAEKFRSLGFYVAPKVAHSETMGTSNQCIILQTTYIEILEIDYPTDNNAGWRSLLKLGAGLRGLAFGGNDLGALYSDLAGSGLDVAQPISFSRPIDNQPDTPHARFQVCRIALEHSPGYRSFVCEHLTPELIWRKQFMDHDNGAQNLMAIVAPSLDPDMAGKTLALLQPDSLRERDDTSPQITIGADSMRPQLSFSVADLSSVSHLLEHNGQSFVSDERGLVVELPDLGGLQLRFESAS